MVTLTHYEAIKTCLTLIIVGTYILFLFLNKDSEEQGIIKLFNFKAAFMQN